MKTLLFIGHKFHEKTRSSDFLVEILKNKYSVTSRSVDPYADNPYRGLKDVNNSHYDVLVFWQIKPTLGYLKNNISYDRGVFFPMYDDAHRVSRIEYWYPYRKFHIINFCKTLHNSLFNAGFISHYIKYFPKPPEKVDFGDPRHAFFWNRTEEVNCQMLEKLCIQPELKRLHIHKAIDPGHTFSPPSTNLAQKMTYSDWYPEKLDMLNEIKNCAIYVAPRKKEGIGMSFLEAMTMGRCVIAPDLPTMNEYITHSANGLLYYFSDPKPFSAFDVLEIQKNARQFMLDGYKSWEEKKSDILKWIDAPTKIKSHRMFPRIAQRIFKRPERFLKIYWQLTSARKHHQ
jgi:hypothetical protein